MATIAAKRIDLTPVQMDAVKSIQDWYKSGKKQTYFLAGYAGTGKSTLVDYVINTLGIKKSSVAFACYTGKAALVLTQKAKGKYKAVTLHRLIYKLDFDSKGKMQFVLKDPDELKDIKLIVVDEASMVDGNIMRDLKSFDKKILFIGDQGQLPPVSNNGNEEFLEMFNNPDFVLTEIHRQAEGNPIIHLSMLARTKKPISYGWYGENKEALVISRTQWETIKQNCYTSADQIICGYNKTRTSLNKDIRKYIGHTNKLPQVGDKLICTRNNWSKNIRDINLVNGMTGYVKCISYDIPNDEEIKRSAMSIDFQPDFTEETFDKLFLVNDHFEGKKYNLLPHEYNIYSQFDFGYAITCHKSQGSQWEKVVVISEVLDPEMHHRWLYTAITRSSERLILVI
ncbi:ATP-dependent RecD-like DNA helicase (plasmid) [Bacillus licheniformis]|uniref:ATP-dependent DNA helicase n=1 Tax=Bacillus licheniformis TaxID=1402 RepID=UPI0009C1E2A0|nr:ATP-dependent RecD-like DNA helicase [Bacillus licheniformis]ARC67275.1 ATP-dependent RecD-like DNA helicase [Bacillus licheniformis]ARW46083.1 Exodeoxyribonuclease V [Bacillus licheniformis]MDE1421930.1 ATP-dependent RecD-like DNA helicase [Bacillus licheniformis]MEC0475935.1 ATP-dependent RecD-like DNA helicase [Bacillus licheniformis]TWK10928.1 ATP-dependent RecD-like DNA helicase [Bacillus licheniformis]